MSYYKLIYWLCFALVHSPMTTPSIYQLELMIYCIIEVIKVNYKYINDVYVQNQSLIKRNFQCYKHIGCTSMNYIVILIMVIDTIDLLAYFMNCYILHTRNHVIKANCTNLQSILRTIITIFNGLSDICIILRKLFINCIVSLQNCCNSHYRFIDWYYYGLIHLPMVLSSINQMELIIYNTIGLIKSNFKDITYISCHNKSQLNNESIQSCSNICTSINCILMMIIEALSTIFLFYELMNDLSVKKHILIQVFNTIIIVVMLTRYPIVIYYQCNDCKTLHDHIDTTIIICWMHMYFVLWLLHDPLTPASSDLLC